LENAVTGVLAFLVLFLSVVIVLMVPAFIAPEFIASNGPVSILDSSQAVLLGCCLAGFVTLLISRSRVHTEFLLRLFLSALLLRMLVAAVIFVFNLQSFFGGDAYTYDSFGFLQCQGWQGDAYAQLLAQAYVNKAGSGWGMVYLVAAIYELVGRNMLATQMINAVLGAATAPLIFLSALAVFENLRVARLSAFAVAFMPSLILWSSQGLKDGPIMFFLALSILATLKLSQKLTWKYLLALTLALVCMLAFRFYIFYMLVVAIGGTLVIGTRVVTGHSLMRQFVLLVVLSVMMTFCGAIMGARGHFETYGSLRQVQVNRLDAATSANSGFAKNTDVSTAAGAVSAIPVGMIYLLLAPFPWQLGSLRQAITLPEMVVWWSSFPMLIIGLCYSIRYHFRQVLPILIFTIMLTLAYSVFQGNVGNAYRQRAQMQIFYFIFAAVGYVVMWQRKRQPERALTRPGLPVHAMDRSASECLIRDV
jgi:4-amino-4-deoxy-L-arabinose transferase-like glycosyltransferase